MFYNSTMNSVVGSEEYYWVIVTRDLMKLYRLGSILPYYEFIEYEDKGCSLAYPLWKVILVFQQNSGGDRCYLDLTRLHVTAY